MTDKVDSDSSEKKPNRRTKDTSNHFIGVMPREWPVWARTAPPPEASPSPQ